MQMRSRAPPRKYHFHPVGFLAIRQLWQLNGLGLSADFLNLKKSSLCNELHTHSASLSIQASIDNFYDLTLRGNDQSHYIGRILGRIVFLQLFVFSDVPRMFQQKYKACHFVF